MTNPFVAMRNPRLSFGIIVLNGEPFIKYNLRNLYPYAHEIIIVEGAVKKFAHAATPDGHSLDATVRIIKEFPDPEQKIKLIQNNGFWPEKDQMSNAYMETCTGDYIWQVDVDEFYKTKDIETVLDMLKANPKIDAVSFKTINFWGSFWAVGDGGIYNEEPVIYRRLFNFKKGYRFHTHRPPTIADENGRVLKHQRYVSGWELAKKNTFLYHYGYVTPTQVQSKAEYYARMKFGSGHQDGVNWYQSNWQEFSNPFRIHFTDYMMTWLVPFEGSHPKVIYDLIKENDVVDPVFDKHIQDFLAKNGDTVQKYGTEVNNIINDFVQKCFSTPSFIREMWHNYLIIKDKNLLNIWVLTRMFMRLIVRNIRRMLSGRVKSYLKSQ